MISIAINEIYDKPEAFPENDNSNKSPECDSNSSLMFNGTVITVASSAFFGL